MNKKNIIFGACVLLILVSSGLCIQDNIIKEERYMQRANEFFYKKDIETAALYYKAVCAINPQNMQARYGLGLGYFYFGEHQKAYDIFKDLSLLGSNNYLVTFMLAKTCRELGKVDEAIRNYKQAIILNPKLKKAYVDLGFLYFKLGDYDKGHRVHCLVEIDGCKGQGGKVDQGSNFYDGHCDIAGKVVLVRDEGGFGDMFQWIRFVKSLKEKGAIVVVEAREAIIPLLSNCPCIDKLVAKETNFTDFDYQIYVGGLFRVYNINLETIPSEVPYLYVDENFTKKWENKLSSDKNFKIGICWDPKKYGELVTGKQMKNNRAIPLSNFYDLSKLDNVSLYCLQQRNGLEQISAMPEDFEIHTFGENFDKVHGSFVDTAAVMKSLDLIITADTSVAHLAGALGVKTWVILPFAPDWRWLLDRSDSPWYPTMKLFRQKKLGDWKSAFSEVMIELYGLLDEHKIEHR